MTTRRQILIAMLGALAPALALAQARPAKVCLFGSIPLSKSVMSPMVLRSLEELGYRDGAGMALQYRYAEGAGERYLAVARQLVGQCDLIFTIGNEPPARALWDVRSQVPVVVIANDFDPIAAGIIGSLARPGGNFTGVFGPTAALAAKRLEVAQEVLPGATRFLVLADRFTRDQLTDLREAAAARRVELTVVEYAREPYDLAAAFHTGRRAKVQGFIGLSSPVFAAHRSALAALLAEHRMVAFVSAFMATEQGFLLSYSYDASKLARRAAEIGVKILKGAKPADIPVEQPTEYQMIVNLQRMRDISSVSPLMWRKSRAGLRNSA